MSRFLEDTIYKNRSLLPAASVSNVKIPYLSLRTTIDVIDVDKQCLSNTHVSTNTTSSYDRWNDDRIVQNLPGKLWPKGASIVIGRRSFKLNKTSIIRGEVSCVMAGWKASPCGRKYHEKHPTKVSLLTTLSKVSSIRTKSQSQKSFATRTHIWWRSWKVRPVRTREMFSQNATAVPL